MIFCPFKGKRGVGGAEGGRERRGRWGRGEGGQLSKNIQNSSSRKQSNYFNLYPVTMFSVTGGSFMHKLRFQFQIEANYHKSRCRERGKVGGPFFPNEQLQPFYILIPLMLRQVKIIVYLKFLLARTLDIKLVLIYIPLRVSRF